MKKRSEIIHKLGVKKNVSDSSFEGIMETASDVSCKNPLHILILLENFWI